MMSIMTERGNYYQILGVLPGARDGDIRQAYRQLCRIYHPDTTTLAPQEALEKFLVINEAYTILSHPTKRVQYDQRLYSLRAATKPVAPVAQPPQQTLEIHERPLSNTEIFALFILGASFLASLILVGFVSLLRG